MHVGSFVVCIVGNLNGTRCRDGVKVLWCHSLLVWFFFFRVPSLCALVFIQKTLCFFLLFLDCCLEMVRAREEDGAKGKMHGL